MDKLKKNEQWFSFVGVILLAIILPGVLKVTNSAVRYIVGAEGRLSSIAVETDRVLGPMPNAWQALAQGGDNLTGFLNGIESKVMAVKPQYIRIDHIYDMFSVVSSDNGGIKYDWRELDRVVNQIATTGAKPFFSLSYMPAALTSSGDILSEPKRWSDWSDLVQKTIEHYSGEMAIDDIYYEVWNEPDLFGKWQMNGVKDYKNLYLYAARGAAKATGVKPFKFGGPATTGLYASWVDNFFPFVLQNNLRLDFYSWHRYDLNLDKYDNDIKNVDKWIQSYPYFSGVEKIISEMGPNSEMGKENDNMVGAAHLVATTRQLMYRAKYGFNFAVSGKWGMVGKPRYEALIFLSRLGKSRLSLGGEGSWVRGIGAKDGSKYQVLLVNFDPKGTHNEVVPVTFLGLKEKKFTMTTEVLGGGKLTNDIATSEAVLQTVIPMAANSVILVELDPKTIN